MGKPGKKNVPITQRAEVKTNSKNKVEEPLLNVGPAGVYGNNQTRKIPSPAKQTAKQKKNLPEAIVKAIAAKSPAKQKKEDKKVKTTAILETSSAGKDIVVKGKEKQRIKTAKDVGVSQAKVDAYNMKKYGTKNPTKDGKTNNKIGTGKFEKDTVKKGKKETTTNSSTKTIRTKDMGDSQTALSRRQTIRGGKVGTRVEMQGKVKSARAKYKNMTKAEKEKAGGRTKYMRKVKNDAKIVRADKNSALGAASAKGAQAQADQNKSALSGQTGNVKSAGRDKDRGDNSQTKQESDNKKELEAKVKLAAAKKAKAAAALVDKKKEDTTITDIKAANAMAPGFFKGKSPLKKNYFKR